MNVHYLFNSSGDWICFKIGKNVFNTNGSWIGWLPWGDDDVVTTEGKYLGTICGNRIYYFVNISKIKTF